MIDGHGIWLLTESVLEKISKIWSTLRSLNFKGASKSQMLKTRKSFSVTGLPTYKIWSLEFMSHTTGTFLTGPFSKEELRITGCKWVMHDLILNSLSNNILKLQIYFVDVFVESMCQLKYQLKIIRGRITIKKNSVHAWTYKYWERETLMEVKSASASVLYGCRRQFLRLLLQIRTGSPFVFLLNTSCSLLLFNQQHHMLSNQIKTPKYYYSNQIKNRMLLVEK